MCVAGNIVDSREAWERGSACRTEHASAKENMKVIPTPAMEQMWVMSSRVRGTSSRNSNLEHIDSEEVSFNKQGWRCLYRFLLGKMRNSYFGAQLFQNSPRVMFSRSFNAHTITFALVIRDVLD